MNFKTSIKTFLALAAIAFVSLITPPPARAQLQSVDPTVGGACNVVTQQLVLLAQTGYFMCYPSSLGSNVGTYQRVNPGQNSITYLINYNNTTLAGLAATTGSVTLVTLPAGAQMESVAITTKTAFVGGGPLTALTVSVGDSSSNTAFSGTRDVFAAVTATSITVGASAVMTTTAADLVFARFTATGGNLNALTAGSVQITLNYWLPPLGAITIASLDRFAPDYPLSAASARRHNPMARLYMSKKQFARG